MTIHGSWNARLSRAGCGTKSAAGERGFSAACSFTVCGGWIFQCLPSYMAVGKDYRCGGSATRNAYLYAWREAVELQREDSPLKYGAGPVAGRFGFDKATSWRSAPARLLCHTVQSSLCHTVRSSGSALGNSATGSDDRSCLDLVENQLTVAIRLIPLGQAASQRLQIAAGPATCYGRI